MKKWITWVLLAAMLTGFTACGDTAEPETDTAEPESTPAETAQEEIDPAKLDELPTDNMEYEGYTFTIMSYDFPDAAIAWRVADIYTEDPEYSLYTVIDDKLYVLESGTKGYTEAIKKIFESDTKNRDMR